MLRLRDRSLGHRRASRAGASGITGPTAHRWVVSYADLVTLLLALFVVLFVVARNSSSHRTAKTGQRLEATSSSLENPEHSPQDSEDAQQSQHTSTVSTETPPTSLLNQGDGIFPGRDSLGLSVKSANALSRQKLAELQSEIADFIFVEGLEHAVLTRLEPRGLVISLNEIGFFDSAQAEPREDAIPVIGTLATMLIRSEHHVRIEGHTDGRPIRTVRFPSNWELSTARASWLVSHFVTKFGMNPERLSAAGYGQFRPVATNQTEAGQAMNRRVDLVLLSRERSEQEEPTVVPALTR